MRYGRYLREGWTEIEVLEGEGGALSQMRVIMRVVNGDLEAELLQMH